MIRRHLAQDDPSLLKTAWFGRVSDVEIAQLPAIVQLIERVQTDDNEFWLLTHFSQLYVLIFDAAAENLAEIKWNHYEINFQGKTHLAAAYMGIEWKSKDGHHYIYYIDSIVRGHGLADYMMKRYESRFGCEVLPKEIMPSAVTFWQKWFERRRKVKTKRDLRDLRDSLDEPSDEWLEWDALEKML